MSEPPAPPVRRRILRNLLLSFLGFCIVAFAVLGWWVTTDSFQQRVRRRVIAKLERATGGRVELGELHTIPFRLRIDARNLTVHGREAPDQAPLMQVERVQAELKIISLFEAEIGLHSLVLDHPVVHLIDYPDGTTNIPGPTVKYSSDKNAIESLISLSVKHMEAHQGSLLWQDQNVPFDLAAGDLSLLLNYSLLRQHYNAHVALGSVTTRWAKYAEFVWSGDATLVLARHRADVKNLTLKSGHSELQFTGKLEDYHNPRVTGDYHGVVDMAEAAAVLGGRQLRQGTAQIAGKATWDLREFALSGNVDAKDLDWSDGKKLSLRNGRLQAAFTIDPTRLRISPLKANLLGGSVTGDVDITNWRNSLEWSKVAARREHARGATPNLQRGSIRLQLAGFPLAPFFGVLSTPKLPLDRLSLVGNASGAVEVCLDWHDSRCRIAYQARRLCSATRPEPNGIPLSGRIDGLYHASRDELDLSALHLTTPTSDIQAAGSLAATSALHVSLTTHNLREWWPLLEAAYGSPQLPFAVHGFATLSGNATGRLSAISFNGNLEVYDFETMLPATRRTPSQLIHWDALSAALQYSNNNVAVRNGSLIHGHAIAHFDLSAGLAGGELEASSPVTMHFELANGDVDEFARLAGVDRPLAGKLGLTVSLSGTRGSPRGDGHFEVSDGMAYGVAIPYVKGTLHLGNGELQFNNVEARAYDALLSGNVGISLSTDAFHLTLTGQNINLNHFPRLQSTRFTMDGIADFSARASGTPEQPSIEAHLRLKDLAFDQQRAGDFYIDAVTTGRQLDVKAHSDFGKSGLTVAGTVGLQKDFPADLKLDFHDLDVVSLLSIYLPGKITARSPVDGTVQLRGPLRMPRALKASAELTSFAVEVERVQVQNVGPVRFEVSDETMIIENFHLAGSGTDFTAHGRAQLAGAQEMDFGLDGTVNMTLLQSLNPKILARGTLGINLAASGTLQQPILQGRIDVKNTFISHNDFPSGLSDLNGVLLFDRNRIQIQDLSGTTGGGTVALSGSANYERGVVQLDVGATAKGVRLRYPPGVSSTANANLRLTGTSNAAVLSGDVVVTKLAVTPGFDFACLLQQEPAIRRIHANR